MRAHFLPLFLCLKFFKEILFAVGREYVSSKSNRLKFECLVHQISSPIHYSLHHIATIFSKKHRNSTFHYSPSFLTSYPHQLFQTKYLNSNFPLFTHYSFQIYNEEYRYL
jgi:hypothetical protein